MKKRKIEKYSKLIRNIGLIIGIPTLIVIGNYLYQQKIEIYNTEIELLETENEQLRNISYVDYYNDLTVLIEGFKNERKRIQNRIYELERNVKKHKEEIKFLKSQLKNFDHIVGNTELLLKFNRTDYSDTINKSNEAITFRGQVFSSTGSPLSLAFILFGDIAMFQIPNSFNREYHWTDYESIYVDKRGRITESSQILGVTSFANVNGFFGINLPRELITTDSLYVWIRRPGYQSLRMEIQIDSIKPFYKINLTPEDYANEE